MGKIHKINYERKEIKFVVFTYTEEATLQFSCTCKTNQWTLTLLFKLNIVYAIQSIRVAKNKCVGRE